jgi:hypothetical protein
VATLATTSNTTPFVNQVTLIDRSHLTGRLYAMVKGSTANTYDLYHSTNNGTSWSLLLSTTRANVSEIGSIFIIDPRFDQMAWVYRTNESSEDRIYYRAIIDLSSPTWSTELLVTSAANGGAAGAVYTGMDIKVFVIPGWQIYAVIAVGAVVGSGQGVSLFSLSGIRMDGMIVNPNLLAGTHEWRVTGSGRSTPSMEIEHGGDGKTASSNTPHIWVTFGRSFLGLVKLAWNGSGWVGPTSHITIRSDLGADDALTGRYDGSRFLMAIPNPSSTSTVVVHERNKANTSTTVRTTPTHTTGVVKNCTVGYNAVSGDIRVYAVGTSTTVLYYCDYIRATGSWSSWATVLATAVLGADGNNYAVRRGSYGNARHDVITCHTGSSTIHTSQALTYTPYAPTWNTTGQAYINGGAADVAATLPLAWIFSDPDASDTQGWYAVSRQIGVAALAYWRASDSTWQAGEVQNASSTTGITLPTAWGLNADANHTYKVKTWDASGLASAYSTALVLVPSAVVNPAITAPTAAQVLTTGSVTVTWTAAQQTAYRVTLQTNPGGITQYDSGWITDTALTHTPPLALADGSGWTATVQTKNTEGLASVIQTRNFTVDYVDPAIPTLVCTAVPANGWIAVVITNPTPTGGQPAVASQDLYRRIGTDDTTSVRIATGLASGATHNDWRAASVTAYQYRSVVFGANGTYTVSAWTT